MSGHRFFHALAYGLMALEFRARDRRRPPIALLREAGVGPGMTVLDFGCGPGGFSVAAARLVGPGGLVLAVDIEPLARRSVEKAAQKEGLTNLRPLDGSETAKLQDRSVDMALLYDVLHDLEEPGPVLTELHRLLKPGGILSVSDHHLEEASLVSRIATSGLFRTGGRTRWNYRFETLGTEVEGR